MIILKKRIYIIIRIVYFRNDKKQKEKYNTFKNNYRKAFYSIFFQPIIFNINFHRISTIEF